MITTLTGSNSYLLRHELKRLVDAFVAEHTDMGLEKLDGEEVSYDRMREALESLPFLASKKLVVLQSPGANKEFLEKSSDLLKNIPETTDVIIIESKPDKRTAYYKFLKKSSELHEFNELDEFSLAKWLVETAKEQSGSISQSDARYLVERVGANQQMLEHELAKLINYDPKITRQTIDLMTDQTPQSTIFELLDSAMSGNHKRAIELYEEQRAMKVEPQQIIAMLAWQLHAVALVKAAGDRDAGDIAKQAKMNPFVVRKTQGIANKMSLADTKDLVRRTLELDIQLKSQSIDADDALMHLLLSIKK